MGEATEKEGRQWEDISWGDVLSGWLGDMELTWQRAVRHSRHAADMAKLANLRFGVVGGLFLTTEAIRHGISRVDASLDPEFMISPVIIQVLVWVMLVTWRIHALHERGEDAVCEEIVKSKWESAEAEGMPSDHTQYRMQQAREMSVIKHRTLHWAMAWVVLMSDVAMLMMVIGATPGGASQAALDVAPFAYRWLSPLVVSVLAPDLMFVIMSMEEERVKPVREFLRSSRLLAAIAVVTFVVLSALVPADLAMMSEAPAAVVQEDGWEMLSIVKSIMLFMAGIFSLASTAAEMSRLAETDRRLEAEAHRDKEGRQDGDAPAEEDGIVAPAEESIEG